MPCRAQVTNYWQSEGTAFWATTYTVWCDRFVFIYIVPVVSTMQELHVTCMPTGVCYSSPLNVKVQALTFTC